MFKTPLVGFGNRVKLLSVLFSCIPEVEELFVNLKLLTALSKLINRL